MINRQQSASHLTHQLTAGVFTPVISRTCLLAIILMQSVVNKVSELYDILYNFAPDCLLVSESWLHGDI